MTQRSDLIIRFFFLEVEMYISGRMSHNLEVNLKIIYMFAYIFFIWVLFIIVKKKIVA